MPIAFLIIGALFLTAAVRGTISTTTVNGTQQEGLLPLLQGEFTGTNNFLLWMVAIWLVGALGYIPGFKPISNAFLALLLIVIFLSNKGFFAQFQSAITGTQSAGAKTATPTATASLSIPTPSQSLSLLPTGSSLMEGLG